jgi:hypothetical protein
MLAQQNNTDNHVIDIDAHYSVGPAEVDIWGSTTPGCAISGGTIACMNGGYYLLSGEGLSIDGPSKWSSGNAAGYPL